MLALTYSILSFNAQSKNDLIKNFLDAITAKPNINTKRFYFLYSEFFLRSLRNQFYKKSLFENSFLAVDGKGVFWCNLWQSFKQKHNLNIWPKFILAPVSVLHGCYSFLVNRNIKNNKHLILGRNFLYESLDVMEAMDSSFKVSVIGAVKKLPATFTKKYTKIKFNFISFKPSSDIMTEGFVNLPKQAHSHINIKNTSKLCRQNFLLHFKKLFYVHSFLSQANFLKEMPEIEAIITNILEEKPDIIYLALGGASGKQEIIGSYIYDFFNSTKYSNDNLYQKKELSGYKPKAIVALGAAFDHLGAGKKQLRTNIFLEKVGLEWLHRLIFVPYRRVRVLDSVINFWWEAV